jgi:hypothetical protein
MRRGGSCSGEPSAGMFCHRRIPPCGAHLTDGRLETRGIVSDLRTAKTRFPDRRIGNSEPEAEPYRCPVLTREGDKSPFDSFDFLTGLQVCFWLVIFKRICGLHCYSCHKAWCPQKDYTILNTESKQICLFVCSIPIYRDQANLPYM